MTDPRKRPSFVELAFRAHGRRIYRFFLRQTGSPSDAEDLTQRVFTDAVDALGRTTSPPDSMLAWLYTVARRRMADEIRQRGRDGRAAPPWDLDSLHSNPEYGPALGAALEDAIGRLPEGQRTVVVLRLLRGIPFAEIAELVGASEAACKMRFARGIERIRDELEDKGHSPLS